jgi:cyclophilin family peptidyl-prolyl cis-trans isomerase/HEAT repeat protein
MRARLVLFSLAGACLSVPAGAQQVPAARVNVIRAEARGAASSNDVALLRQSARSGDAQTARIAVRALGRLERPALIPDILPALRHSLPELRTEAANALAQAVQGWAAGGSSVNTRGSSAAQGSSPLPAVLGALSGRLSVEDEPSVRAAVVESIGRLPYRDTELTGQAEDAILADFYDNETVVDRLGVAKALEAFVRTTRFRGPAGPALIAALKALLALPGSEVDPLRDARVRRLALEALTTASGVDDDIVAGAALDPDPQVRRLAMKAAWTTGRGVDRLFPGLEDPSVMVRLEALRGIRERGGDEACASSLAALNDVQTPVVLLALDQLSKCGTSSEAVTRLEATINDLSRAGSVRGWHRAAHALVALAQAAPDRADKALGQFMSSSIWQLRMYAARAAASMKDRARLEALAGDSDDNVVEAAIEGLVAVAGHDADTHYVRALTRGGYQALRVAALALDGTPHADVATPALRATLDRLVAEDRDNSVDVRTAITKTLTGLGASASKPVRNAPASNGPRPALSDLLNGEDLRELASPRARITIADVGSFDLALITSEAPGTVLRFADLAESGYYNGLTFHRVVPNFVIQGGSPSANEYVGIADHMRDEVGLWPHVRGAVGISTRGRDTGDAQIFIDLVDNPRLDHQYTVFAQVLNGIEIVDKILEGDVIERVEILR